MLYLILEHDEGFDSITTNAIIAGVGIGSHCVDRSCPACHVSIIICMTCFMWMDWLSCHRAIWGSQAKVCALLQLTLHFTCYGWRRYIFKFLLVHETFFKRICMHV